MEPLKSLVPFAKWLLRAALVLMVYALHFDRAISFDFDSVAYVLSLLIVIFTILLFVGGFAKRASLTVVSGMLVFLFSLIMIFLGEITLNSLISNAGPLAIGFYFMARGNKG